MNSWFIRLLVVVCLLMDLVQTEGSEVIEATGTAVDVARHFGHTEAAC